MINEINFLFTNTSVPKLQLFFQQNPEFDISKLKDQKRNTVIHQAAFQNNLPILKLFIDHLKKVIDKQYWDNNVSQRKPTKQRIQEFVNQGNSEGYTCIHYASYKGNVEMIQFLESLGANVMILTNLGLNCLHLTAQGDQISSALYFYDKFDINSIDNKKGTALHWAAYVGSDDVTAFLLAQQQIQIDNFDAEDQTPLHIAVLYGNTSIVKKLLIKGVDRTLPNGKGQKAIDIANKNQFQRIAAILNNNYGIFDKIKFYFNVRIKYQPQSRSYLRSFLFFLILVISLVSTHLLILPNFDYLYIYLGLGLNGLLVLVYFTLLFQPKDDIPIPYKQLINRLPICSQCKIPKLPRTHHCNICKRCIRQYDHHCPWINGCVGKHNIKIFPCFLILLILVFFQIGFLCVVGIFQIQTFMTNFRYANDNKIVSILYKILLGIVLSTIALFICPIIYLFYVQMMNLFYGKTTFQRFGGKPAQSKIVQQPEQPSTDNQLDHRLLNHNQQQQQQSCSIKNCISMCCTNQESSN